MIEQQSSGISWSLFGHQRGRARRPRSDNGRYVNFLVHFVYVTPSAERLCWQALRRMPGTLPAKGTRTALGPAGGECPLLSPRRREDSGHGRHGATT